jgi:iron complex transport system substrate-binding protein
MGLWLAIAGALAATLALAHLFAFPGPARLLAQETTPESGAPSEPSQTKKNLRIISLYAADTEILLRLGARETLVGISRQETYEGPETENWQRPQEFSIHDDVEKFLAAAPDYVLLRPMHLSASPALFETLAKAGVKLWAKQCSEATKLYDFWLELGQLAGKEKEAQAMVEDFKARVGSLTYHGDGPRPGVFLESIHKEVKTFTPDSIPAWLLTLAGGNNVATDSEPTRPGQVVANYGPEKFLEKAGQIDILISQEGPMNKVSLETIKSRKIYSVTPALKNNRVYRVPEELISRPSPSLAEGLELLKGMIHPPAKN